MAGRQKRSKDISLSIESFTLTAGPSGSYGFKLSGKAPPMVAQVQAGSAAARAGVQVGDFVLKVGGRDTRDWEGEAVLRVFKESVGTAVEVRVARPSPIPVTDKEKRRALIVLQTKLDSGSAFQPSVPAYTTAVQDALLATQNILGDLGLDQPSEQVVPGVTGGSVQEVELKMYDSDSLPSPPPSSGESDGGLDPLLDFSREDDLTYRAGQSPATQSLAESVRQAQEALQGIQSLAASLEKRGQDKERKKAAAPQVSTEATFQPSVTRRGRSKSPPSTQAPTITSQSKPERWNPKVAVEYPLPTSQPASTAVRAREQVARETVSQPMTHAQPPPPQPTATGGEDKGPPVPPHARGSALGSRGDKERERTESERRERERREREREEREREERERERREREERERERREREERERERREREEKEERERREREKMEKEREKREKEKIEEERERRERELRRAAEAEVVLRRRDKKVPKPDSQKAMIVPGPSAPVSLENVPLRKKKTKDVPAGLEPQGHIADMPSGYRQLNPAPMPPSLPLSDLASQEAACKGLPNSVLDWRGEDVVVWLRQLSPTLSQLYLACFTRHDITGRTLMRLTMTKLKTMGVDNVLHCRQLALEIAKLKIYQESLELRELEEDNQVTFL